MKKQVRIVIMLVLLGAAGIINAQNLVPRKCYLRLAGTINKDFPFEMNLVKIGDTLYGDYLFLLPNKIPFGKTVTGQGIPVCGKMITAASFSLKEPGANPGSLFTCKFTGGQMISGTFESTAGSKPLPFEATEKYPEGSISMNVYYQKAFTPLVKKPKSPGASVQLGLLLPGESANPLISDSLIRLMMDKFAGRPVKIVQPEKLLDGMKQVYFENYLSTNEGIYNETMASSFSWQSLKFVHVLMNDSHILSFYIDHYASTGGAHGLQTRQYTVVNLWTGREVELSDIFKANTNSQLSAILGDKIHELNKLPASQTLKDAGFYADTVGPASNFYITREGIGFFYNQYDIASYAMGSIDIFIPFHELKELLLEGGVVRELRK